ncbi:MAG TPA: hypothetical protein VFV38_48310 [Ktedonobacteraceae bacterium]|nr:hypothetical protein [Ktedonobacteraceae bacterium]
MSPTFAEKKRQPSARDQVVPNPLPGIKVSSTFARKKRESRGQPPSARDQVVPNLCREKAAALCQGSGCPQPLPSKSGSPLPRIRVSPAFAEKKRQPPAEDQSVPSLCQEKAGVQRAAALCRGSGCPRKTLFPQRGGEARGIYKEKAAIAHRSLDEIGRDAL